MRRTGRDHDEQLQNSGSNKRGKAANHPILIESIDNLAFTLMQPSCPPLLCLRLRDTPMTRTDMNGLIKAITSSQHSLQLTLDFQSNRLKDPHIISLIDCLKRAPDNIRISILIAYNAITCEGAKAIAEAIYRGIWPFVNNNLNLCGNLIEYEGATAITAAFIEKAQPMFTLDLSNNRLEDDSAETIAMLLATRPHSTDLTFNLAKFFNIPFGHLATLHAAI